MTPDDLKDERESLFMAGFKAGWFAGLMKLVGRINEALAQATQQGIALDGLGADLPSLIAMIEGLARNPPTPPVVEVMPGESVEEACCGALVKH